MESKIKKYYVGYFNGSVYVIEANETHTEFKTVKKVKTGCEKRALEPIGRLRKEYNATKVCRWNDIPGHKEMRQRQQKEAIERKAEEREREALLKKYRIQLAATAFKNYSNAFASEAKALSHLIQYLNRYAKCFPSGKQASKKNENTVSQIYQLKDKWIQANKTSITSAVIADVIVSSWIDWGSLHSVQADTKEWQDSDDYRMEWRYNLYAYEFDIEGDIARFHSSSAVVEGEIKSDSSAKGRAKPLTDEERIIPLKDALYLACGGLAEDPDRYCRVTDLKPPAK